MALPTHLSYLDKAATHTSESLFYIAAALADTLNTPILSLPEKEALKSAYDQLLSAHDKILELSN